MPAKVARSANVRGENNQSVETYFLKNLEYVIVSIPENRNEGDVDNFTYF